MEDIARFTLISSASSPILYMDFARKKLEIELVAKFFNDDSENHDIKVLQEMTPALRGRIRYFDNIGEKSYKIKKYFEEIPDGQLFFVIPDHIEDQIAIYDILSKLANLNGMAFNNTIIDNICNYLRENYEVLVYKGDDRQKIGVAEKAKRVCRFCGRSMPDVHFKNRSHAISESLGNKGLICLEECDECNKRFNETIEQDIPHLFANQLFLSGIAGKNGVPSIKGDGFHMKLDTNSRAKLGRDTIVLKLKDMPNSRSPIEILESINKEYELFLPYTPQNIYKCFCKYVLSLIDTSDIKHFGDTISWINESTSEHRLPPVWHYTTEVDSERKQTSYMLIMKRKHNAKEIPYCWAILSIAGDNYLFIVPFCSKDKYRFIGKKRQDFFINVVQKMMPDNITLQPIQLSGTKIRNIKLRTAFELSPGCIEGRDYYFLDSSEQ